MTAVERSTSVKVLLVEDSEADVYLVKEAIRSEGLNCQVEVADDGEAAIRVLDRMEAEDQPGLDLVLLDLNVPRKDGTHVLERLRRSPQWGSTPVLMISSSNSPADRSRAFDLGATEYFRKPSTLAEFMELGKVVRRLCEPGTPQE